MHALRLHPILETLYRDRQNKFGETMFRYRVIYYLFIYFIYLCRGGL